VAPGTSLPPCHAYRSSKGPLINANPRSLSTGIFILCFLTPPEVDLYAHTRPFLLFICTRFLSVASTTIEYYLQDDPRIPPIPSSTVGFIIIKGLISTYLCIVPELTYVHYYAHRHEKDFAPYHPWWLSCAVDYSWVVTVVIAKKFVPEQGLLVGKRHLHTKTLKGLRRAFSATLPVLNSELVDTMKAFHTIGCKTISEKKTDVVSGITVAVLRGRLQIDERVLENLDSKQRTGLFHKPACRLSRERAPVGPLPPRPTPLPPRPTPPATVHVIGYVPRRCGSMSPSTVLAASRSVWTCPNRWRRSPSLS